MELGYYRRFTEGDPHGYHEVQKGELVYVKSVDADGQVRYLCGENTYERSEDAFFEHFVFAPEGKAERQRQLLEAIDAVEDLTVEQVRMASQLQLAESQSLMLAGPTQEPVSAETGTEVAVVGGHEAPAKSLRESLAESRRSITKVQKNLAARQEQIKAIIEEKKAIALAKVAEMQEIVGLFQEGIETINLYLGEDEEIVKIQNGAPAPAETVISIHQEVLFMDEETAVYKAMAEEGGVDFENIETFDDWLLADPKHLQAMLPEPRGIRVFRPRREAKDYARGDTSFAARWMNAEKNKANFQSYFLIRNGENLYRIWTPLDVGHRLFPNSEEFNDHFKNTRFDWESRERVEEHIRPGTPEFQKALKRADKMQRHYLKILLLLQGLFDRTPVFAPLVRPRVNIMDPAEYYDVLSFVKDGERALGTGRPSFKTWVSELNAGLDVGQRIVGNFGWGSFEKGDSRLTPNGVDRPSNQGIYTIEDKLGPTRFVFRFDRGEVWNPYTGYNPAKRRASCAVYPSDDFIINIDLAQEDDLRWYLSSKGDRYHYLTMIPLMKMALKLKEHERTVEAPFRALLIRSVVQAHGHEQDFVEPQIDELIAWYKFSNKTHRALAEDDQKAYRMITAEYGIRQTRSEERSKISDAKQSIAERIKATGRDYILIAHKAGNEFVALVRANERTIFVHEELWKTNRSELRLASTKEWQTVEYKRVMRWERMFEIPEFEKWQFNLTKKSYLTDPEINELVEAIKKKTALKEHSFSQRSEAKMFEPDFDIIAIVYDEKEDGGFTLWGCDCKLKNKPEFGPIDSIYFSFHYLKIGYGWSRDKGALKLGYGNSNHYSYEEHTFGSNCGKILRPWSGDKNNGRGIMVYLDQGAIDRTDAKVNAAHEYRTAHLARATQLKAPMIAIEDYMKEKFFEAHKTRFLQDGGLLEDWEDDGSYSKSPRKNLNFGMPRTDLQDRIILLFDKGLTLKDFDGMSVEDLYARTDALGYVTPPNEEDGWRDSYYFRADKRPVERVQNVIIRISPKVLSGKDEDEPDEEPAPEPEPEVEEPATETPVEDGEMQFDVLPPE